MGLLAVVYEDHHIDNNLAGGGLDIGQPVQKGNEMKDLFFIGSTIRDTSKP